MKPIERYGLRTILSFLCLASTAGAWSEALQSPDTGKKVRVFLFAGQSNMEGRADGNKLSETDLQRLAEAQKRVQLAFNHESIRPLDVVKPSPEIEEIYQRDLIFGPELFFGIALSEAWPDERFLFIKLAAGGTSLHGCWNPQWSPDRASLMNEEDDPKLYEGFVKYINELLSEYEDNEYEICAMLWVQGESDGNVEIAAQQYGVNLQNLVGHVRNDVNDPDLPFLLFQVGNRKVVEGMKRTAQDVGNVTLIPQDQKNTSADFYQKMENGHYNHEGLKKLGGRFAEVFLSEYEIDLE